MIFHIYSDSFYFVKKPLFYRNIDACKNWENDPKIWGYALFYILLLYVDYRTVAVMLDFLNTQPLFVIIDEWYFV